MTEQLYPFFPELPEAGAVEAQELVDKFKKQLKKVANEVIGDLYCDVACFIESDSWTNYRNKIMDGFRDYRNNKIQGAHDFKEIRQQIYKKFRDEIIEDLNQDMLEEIESLKKQVEYERELRRTYA